MIFRFFQFCAAIPSHVAIAGGWGALVRSAFKVLRAEGIHGFAVRLRRLLAKRPPSPTVWPPRISVDVQHYHRSELAGIASGLRFPRATTPEVTVILTVYNEIGMTLGCLAAMLRHPQRTSYALIVVDDASSDETETLLANVDGLTYIRNTPHCGYSESVSRALTDSRGEFIYLLSNHTQVQANWLDALVARMHTAPEVAVAGSMLLFPDGTVQEVGAMLVQPHDPSLGALTKERVGMPLSPLHPDYALAREVEYCSRASLLVRRRLFDRVRGFDRRFGSTHFADADLAYAAREAGWKVYVEPRSKVVHCIGVSISDNPSPNAEFVRPATEHFLEKWGAAWRLQRRIRTIAIYLPQFHPIPENDAWWGEGFTEWTNVRKAKPNFEGHMQPHVPTELGYYDLRTPDTRERQALLAQQHNVDGFCYYYYWFGGRRLLHKPLDDLLSSRSPDFPFCVCWANENWTRSWDGQDSHVLIAQQHSPEDDIAFIESLFDAFKDPRYIRVNGRPILLIYKTHLLPDIRATAERWRRHCRQHGIGELYLACVHNSGNPALNINPKTIGFDAAVEFPPSGKGVPTDGPASMLNSHFRGRFYSYELTATSFMRTPLPPYPFLRTVMPAWDNTARRQDAAHIFLGSSPEVYAHWLSAAAEWTARYRSGDERLLFINAWNEWAEGNHLEPDLRYGRAYLEATQRALDPYKAR